MFTHPFTRVLNLTTPRRPMLEGHFVNSDPRGTFLPRNTCQIVPLKQCIYWVITINSLCLATDIPKHSGIQKKKNTLNGYHCTDFWCTFDELWLLNEHCTIFFISHISSNALLGTTTKNLKKILCRVLFLRNNLNKP